jgi:glucose-1-phosphate thymidylyltransferase
VKGIILAGGSGTRLYPNTFATSKQMLPIYDKPIIYYPLSILMMAGIREILIITTPQDEKRFQDLLGDGKKFGITLSYAIQNKPDGLAQAFIIGEEFIGNDTVCLALGDNIFYGHDFANTLRQAKDLKEGAIIFGYHVMNPECFGVVEFDAISGEVVSLEEKPSIPKSNYAIPGLYFFDNDVVSIAKKIKPSSRGELEITSINEEYLKAGRLRAERLGRGFAWFDTGTFDSILEASNFIKTVEKCQGLKIACLEEIAYRNKWISKNEIIERGKIMHKNSYGKHLLHIAENLDNI